MLLDSRIALVWSCIAFVAVCVESRSASICFSDSSLVRFWFCLFFSNGFKNFSYSNESLAFQVSLSTFLGGVEIVFLAIFLTSLNHLDYELNTYINFNKFEFKFKK